MKENLLFFIIFISLGLIFVFLSILLKDKDKKMLRQCNKIVKGKVIKYSVYDNGVHFPIVEYIVNNNKYTQKLKYSWIITKESSFYKIDSEVQNNIDDENLTIKKNANISTNALEKHFPIGTELDVYYNPQKPKQSYVMRFAKSTLTKVFFFTGLFFVILAFIGLKFINK